MSDDVALERTVAPPDEVADRITAHLQPLTGLDTVPLGEHPARFAQVHEALQGELTEIDS